ncbi:ubiquinone biosynthesis accessory factor UbiJ [Hydrocarboniclastica marina]|uniref:Ubiquinone biosynthesis accessory factor UbiJ n=1 Tax=Hydrocarboniclastica marina TaxID=2259620 RepID=A0A4P7XLV2_9ALTE|nr:SCP2 sterol-binding domain-containing protein [Hydrocarboniclastica marina]QCF26957.1 hypothetical protein soil367_14010 [Hydrocarboniclastica marina]
MREWGLTLGSAIAATVEQALNRSLGLDPVSHEALRKLLEEPFLIRLEPPGLELWLTADHRTLHVQQHCALEPALTLTGSPLAFAAAALGDPHVFRDERVKAVGDVSLAHHFQRLLQQMEPDWEASLAKAVGGVPAHFIARRVRQSLRWSREARQTLSRNVEEYLHEESRTLPARGEAEAFFEDVDNLRLDTDRLAARLDLLSRPRAEPPEYSASGKQP